MKIISGDESDLAFPTQNTHGAENSLLCLPNYRYPAVLSALDVSIPDVLQTVYGCHRPCRLWKSESYCYLRAIFIFLFVVKFKARHLRIKIVRHIIPSVRMVVSERLFFCLRGA